MNCYNKMNTLFIVFGIELLLLAVSNSNGDYVDVIEIDDSDNGSIYKAYDDVAKRHVIIKLATSEGEALLEEEEKFYFERFQAQNLSIDNDHGIPRVYDSGNFKLVLKNDSSDKISDVLSGTTSQPGIVMELLGSSYESIFRDCGSRFSKVTSCYLGIQMVEILEYVHHKGVIFRDISPGNFMIGGLKKSRQSYIIDFGLAISTDYKIGFDACCGTLPYINPGICAPIVENFEPELLQKLVKYVSHSNGTLFMERRENDDLISVGILLMEFILGSKRIPWDNRSIVTQCKMMLSMNLDGGIDKFCTLKFPEMAEYFKYLFNLDEASSLDYNKLKKIFIDVLKENGYVAPYKNLNLDWEKDWYGIAHTDAWDVLAVQDANKLYKDSLEKQTESTYQSVPKLILQSSSVKSFAKREYCDSNGCAYSYAVISSVEFTMVHDCFDVKEERFAAFCFSITKAEIVPIFFKFQLFISEAKAKIFVQPEFKKEFKMELNSFREMKNTEDIYHSFPFTISAKNAESYVDKAKETGTLVEQYKKYDTIKNSKIQCQQILFTKLEDYFLLIIVTDEYGKILLNNNSKSTSWKIFGPYNSKEDGAKDGNIIISLLGFTVDVPTMIWDLTDELPNAYGSQLKDQEILRDMPNPIITPQQSKETSSILDESVLLDLNQQIEQIDKQLNKLNVSINPPTPLQETYNEMDGSDPSKVMEQRQLQSDSSLQSTLPFVTLELVEDSPILQDPRILHIGRLLPVSSKCMDHLEIIIEKLQIVISWHFEKQKFYFHYVCPTDKCEPLKHLFGNVFGPYRSQMEAKVNGLVHLHLSIEVHHPLHDKLNASPIHFTHSDVCLFLEDGVETPKPNPKPTQIILKEIELS